MIFFNSTDADILNPLRGHFQDDYRHRPHQCTQCYAIFEGDDGIDQLMRHQDGLKTVPCQPRPSTFKEGIDDTQWRKIEELMGGRRRKHRSEKSKHDIDVWFEIWDLLFPDRPRPNHPCKYK